MVEQGWEWLWFLEATNSGTDVEGRGDIMGNWRRCDTRSGRLMLCVQVEGQMIHDVLEVSFV